MAIRAPCGGDNERATWCVEAALLWHPRDKVSPQDQLLQEKLSLGGGGAQKAIRRLLKLGGQAVQFNTTLQYFGWTRPTKSGQQIGSKSCPGACSPTFSTHNSFFLGRPILDSIEREDKPKLSSVKSNFQGKDRQKVKQFPFICFSF